MSHPKRTCPNCNESNDLKNSTCIYCAHKFKDEQILVFYEKNTISYVPLWMKQKIEKTAYKSKNLTGEKKKSKETLNNNSIQQNNYNNPSKYNRRNQKTGSSGVGGVVSACCCSCCCILLILIVAVGFLLY